MSLQTAGLYFYQMEDNKSHQQYAFSSLRFHNPMEKRNSREFYNQDTGSLISQEQEAPVRIRPDWRHASR